MVFGKKRKYISNESGKSFSNTFESTETIYIQKERGFNHSEWIPKVHRISNSTLCILTIYICFYIYIYHIIHHHILNSHRNNRRKEKKKKKNINGLIQLWTFSVQWSVFFFWFYLFCYFLSSFINWIQRKKMKIIRSYSITLFRCEYLFQHRKYKMILSFMY